PRPGDRGNRPGRARHPGDRGAVPDRVAADLPRAAPPARRPRCRARLPRRAAQRGRGHRPTPRGIGRDRGGPAIPPDRHRARCPGRHPPGGAVTETLGPLLPEVTLAAGAVTGLLAGSWLPRRRQWAVQALAATACLVALAATAVVATHPDTADFGTSYAIDTVTSTVRVVVLSATVLVIGLSPGTLRAPPPQSQVYRPLLLAAPGPIPT